MTLSKDIFKKLGPGPMTQWLRFHTLHFSSPGLQIQIQSKDLLHSPAMLWRCLTCKTEANW